MVSASLLTFCVGLVCSISKSTINYDIARVSSSMHALTKELQASRVRLQGFNEWLRLKTDANILDFLHAVDYNINPTLEKIRQNVDVAIREGKVAEQCYTVALQNIKQKTEQQLPAVVSCIQTIKNFTNVILANVPVFIYDMNLAEHQVYSVIPNCKGSKGIAYCVLTGLADVRSTTLALQGHSRYIVEHGNTKYLKQYRNAMTRLQPVLTELNRQARVVLDELNLCIRSAKTVS